MLKDFPCGEQSCPAFLSVQTFLTSIFTPQDPRKKQQTYLCPLGPCAPCSCWSMHDETSGLATLRFGLWTKVLHPGSVMSTSALKKTGPKAINISSFTTFQKKNIYIYMHIYIYVFVCRNRLSLQSYEILSHSLIYKNYEILNLPFCWDQDSFRNTPWQLDILLTFAH